jgi:dTMP kinase
MVLTVLPEVGRARTLGRREPVDRLEGEQSEFFEAIARAYEQLAVAEPDRIRTVDDSQSPGAVLGAAVGALADLLSQG